MSKAEEKAFEVFPDIPLPNLGNDFVAKQGHLREAYIRGYEQAEKDLALTWEDVQLLYIITGRYESEINKNLEGFPSSSQEMFEEILRRFKEAKK